MSDEKVVEGVGKGKLRLPISGAVEQAGTAIRSRVKLEKYRDGVLYETIIEDFENNGDH